MERERIAWDSAGEVTVQRIGPGQLARPGPIRLHYGLEVYRERRPEGPTEYLVSFVNVQGFRAEMRLAVRDGRLVVSELHVTPDVDLPPGGITSRLLRYVPIHAHVGRVTRATLESLLPGTSLEATLLRALDTPSTPSGAATPRPGRHPVATETLLDVAAAYARAVAGGSTHPAYDAATQLGMKKARVRDYVHRARRRGFLTDTRHGRPGGELTPEARAMLKAAARKKPQRSGGKGRR